MNSRSLLEGLYLLEKIKDLFKGKPSKNKLVNLADAIGSKPTLLKGEISKYLDNESDDALLIAAQAVKSAEEDLPSCKSDLIVALVRYFGEKEPSHAVEFSKRIGLDDFDERALKSLIIFSKRAGYFFHALSICKWYIQLPAVTDEIWVSDQQAELFERLIMELATDDPQQIRRLIGEGEIQSGSKLEAMMLESGPKTADLYRSLFIKFKDEEGEVGELALDAGKAYGLSAEEPRFLDVLSTRLKRAELQEAALSALERAIELEPTKKRLERYTRLLSGNSDLQDNDILERAARIIPKKYSEYLSLIDFLIQRKTNPVSAIEHAQVYLSQNSDIGIRRMVARSVFDLGQIDEAIRWLNVRGKEEKDKKTLKFWKSVQKLDRKGLSWKSASSHSKEISKKEIVYLLHNSPPYHSGGYATRSHGLMLGVLETDWSPRVLSRLGYPHDLKNWKAPDVVNAFDTIDGLRYERLFTESKGYGSLPLGEYIVAYADAVVEHLLQTSIPEIIHGASNFMNGFAAVRAAQILGVKSVYEVRGLWEVTRASRDALWMDSQHYNLLKRLETEVAIKADQVIAITSALADEMVSRGVERDKIIIIPNGVDPLRFPPQKRDVVLAKKLGIVDKTVIGYIGSIVMYEGLELVVEAYSKLNKNIQSNCVLLFVGDGATLPDLRNSCEEYELTSEQVIFAGRVPHEEVNAYYSLIDIAPLPRLSLPVTEMVSPMKPFEAMSMKKLVVASNVAALAEIVEDNVTGRLFEKDDADDLARIITEELENPEHRETLGAQSREWVIANRDWNSLGRSVSEIYDSMI